MDGNVFLYYGSAGGLAPSPSVTLENPTSEYLGMFGNVVADAVVVDGDRFPDLLVGASYQSAGAEEEGNAFLYLGSETGPPASPSFTFDSPANQAYAHFGWAADGAGDVNGDGFADVVVATPAEDVGTASEAGAAYLYLGSALGLPAAPSVSLHPAAPHYREYFGNDVDGAGDLNADGYADIVVGSPEDAMFAAETAYVYYGGPGGIPDSPSVTLPNTGISGSDFGYVVGAAGDVNGDGIADLLVGARSDHVVASGEGSAYLYLGTNSGINDRAWARLDNPTHQSGGGFGTQLTCAGDVNGDGIADVLISAPYQTTGASREGSTFLFYGAVTGLPLLPSVTLDNPANQVDGNFGWSLACIDVVVGQPVVPEYPIDGVAAHQRTARVNARAGEGRSPRGAGRPAGG